MNTTDITNVSDKVLDIFLSVKADPDTAIDADHLTRSERYDLATLLGWDMDASHVATWIAGQSVPTYEEYSDCEGSILAEQENDPTWWG